jgi:hypothetical protein
MGPPGNAGTAGMSGRQLIGVKGPKVDLLLFTTMLYPCIIN